MYGSDLAEQFLRSLKISQRSEKTVTVHRNAISLFGRFQLARNRTFYLTTTECIEEYICSLQDRKLAPRTIALYLISVRVLFRWAFHRGKIDSDPCALLDKIRLKAPTPRVPDWASFAKLLAFPLESETDYRDRAIILILYATGLRISEFCSLRAGTISLETGEFRIKGKGRKEDDEICLISGEALRDLRAWLAIHQERVGAIDPMRALFLGRHDKPLSQNAVRRMIDSRARAAGVSSHREYESGVKKLSFHPHAFRHLHATEMLRAGVALPIIQKSLRHRSISATAVYMHVQTDQLKEAHRMRDEFLRIDPPPEPGTTLPFRMRAA